MAYFLTCVHPYHDDELGMIERGQQVREKSQIARIYHDANREHHFVKSFDTTAAEQWSWPPEKEEK